MRNLFLILLLIASLHGYAQPVWEVNPGEYSNGMTLVGVVVFDGVESKSVNDMVGAFVNGQCRGVAKPQFVSSLNRYLVFLQIYSNESSGEQISFKLFRSSNDSVYSCPNPLTFKVNETVGSNSNPYVLTTNNPPSGILLSASIIDENKAVGTEIGRFTTQHKDTLPRTHAYTILQREDYTAFTINEDKLMSARSFDFEKQSAYTIYVQTDDGKGGLLEDKFIIKVSDINDMPVMQDTSFAVKEHEDNLTLVGKVEASDQDTGQMLSYSIVEGNTDNSFQIDPHTGEIAIANAARVDYVRNPLFTLKVKVEDNGSPQLSAIATVLIKVNKTELILNAPAFFSPNGDPVNDTWKIEKVHKFSDFELFIFNSTGEIVYQTLGYKNDWNGIYKGRELPVDVYYYLFKSNVKPQVLKGTISIVR